MKNYIGLPLTGDPPDINLKEGELILTTKAEAIGQHVAQRLKTHKGEWFLDTTAGLKWIENIHGRRFDPALTESLIKKEILETEGVTEIVEFSVIFNDTTRELKINKILINTIYDEVVNIG